MDGKTPFPFGQAEQSRQDFAQQLMLSQSEAVKDRLAQLVKGQEQLVADVKIVVGMLPSTLTDEQAFAVQRLLSFILKTG